MLKYCLYGQNNCRIIDHLSCSSLNKRTVSLNKPAVLFIGDYRKFDMKLYITPNASEHKVHNGHTIDSANLVGKQ